MERRFNIIYIQLFEDIFNLQINWKYRQMD